MNNIDINTMYISTHVLNTFGISQMKSTQWLLLSTHACIEHFSGVKLNTFGKPKKQIQAMVEKPLKQKKG